MPCEINIEKAAFIIYLTVLVLSPLLFGAVHPYAYTMMAFGVLAAAVLLIIKNIQKDSRQGIYTFRVPRTSLNLLFVGMTAFLIVLALRANAELDSDHVDGEEKQ